MSLETLIWEKDDKGRICRTKVTSDQAISLSGRFFDNKTRVPLLEFIGRVFLPTGYPGSVSPDYLRYQIFNALQAFCSSLASLISSRAILEGFGVGNAAASATNALLLTVLQDIFSRLTTIVAAYFIGSSLSPEAKTYRLLADILNDGAIVLDTLSPLFNSPSLPVRLPGLRVSALCLSGSLRSLCGIAAGGSKAAITLHFANPIGGNGDVGDLNAKDASKETVLALLGMLLGSFIVPYLTTPWSTYSVLFLLVGLHLGLNYMGVRGLALRSLNRQRAGIAWAAYRRSAQSRQHPPVVPSPREVSQVERIFERPGILRGTETGGIAGQCTMGSSFSEIYSHYHDPKRLIEEFQREKYILWYDPGCLVPVRVPGRQNQGIRALELNDGSGHVKLHVCLREGHSHIDVLRAWVHAWEVGSLLDDRRRNATEIEILDGEDEATAIIRVAHRRVDEEFSGFVEGLKTSGWITNDGALMTRAPKRYLTSIEVQKVDITVPSRGREDADEEKEGKKYR